MITGGWKIIPVLYSLNNDEFYLTLENNDNLSIYDVTFSLLDIDGLRDVKKVRENSKEIVFGYSAGKDFVIEHGASEISLKRSIRIPGTFMLDLPTRNFLIGIGNRNKTIVIQLSVTQHKGKWLTSYRTFDEDNYAKSALKNNGKGDKGSHAKGAEFWKEYFFDNKMVSLNYAN